MFRPRFQCRLRIDDGELKGIGMRAILLATVLFFAGAAVARAQDQEGYRGDAAVSYHWVRANAGPGECGCFGLNGGGVSGSWDVRGPFSVVLDISAETAGSAPTN